MPSVSKSYLIVLHISKDLTYHSKVATVFNTTTIVLGPPNAIPDGTLLKNIMLQ